MPASFAGEHHCSFHILTRKTISLPNTRWLLLLCRGFCALYDASFWAFRWPNSPLVMAVKYHGDAGPFLQFPLSGQWMQLPRQQSGPTGIAYDCMSTTIRKVNCISRILKAKVHSWIQVVQKPIC